jgi:hypothetical protein
MFPAYVTYNDSKVILTKTWNQLKMRPVAQWLGHYATSRKTTDSRIDDVIKLFSIYLIIPAALDSGVYSASNRNEYQKRKNNISGEKSAAGS